MSRGAADEETVDASGILASCTILRGFDGSVVLSGWYVVCCCEQLPMTQR
jgi:hypothetical protein